MPESPLGGGCHAEYHQQSVGGVTIPQVLLTTVVLTFTGWMSSRGVACHVALLIASGGVTVGSGLAYVPRGIARFARALGQQS